MRLKRIKNIRVNSYEFEVAWPKDMEGARFNYTDRIIEVGTKNRTELELLESVCHELFELCAEEMRVRYRRPDCETDYLFAFDHRQHDTLINMFSGLLSRFLP